MLWGNEKFDINRQVTLFLILSTFKSISVEKKFKNFKTISTPVKLIQSLIDRVFMNVPKIYAVRRVLAQKQRFR